MIILKIDATNILSNILPYPIRFSSFLDPTPFYARRTTVDSTRKISRDFSSTEAAPEKSLAPELDHKGFRNTKNSSSIVPSLQRNTPSSG